MKFKPFGKKYDFDNSVLVRDFPVFMHNPLSDWIADVLNTTNGVVEIDSYYNYRYIVSSVHNNFQLILREKVPNKLHDFISFALEDSDRTANVLTLLLQNFADERDAQNLSKILEVSGSAYDVFKSEKDASEYDKGAYILIERVDKIVNEVSKTALESSSLLSDAWKYCYSRSPDYEKTVTRVCDFLESFLGKIYFPNDPKPQLKKFIHSFEENPVVLAYKGDTIVTPKNLLTNLLKEVSNIRGQHTEGKGRQPTKDEAIFVLHTSILIWNLHK